ncbi:MAG: biotin--[acetyl-CoA-carboxylase] ligase [Oscillospiraceae bacterium]|nr:biotin--[acetyl-CoA-carboxylase] ligase [Oscillospiraceae bacterium]
MSKVQVLRLLQSSDDYVSGERISETLGITRAAVWKAVDALRRDGCEVDSKKSRGYRLISAPDRLGLTELRACLGETKRLGHTLHCFAQIDSTNAFLKRAATEADAPDGTVAVADEQTGGRGRRGRSFLSPAGKGVYLSVLLRPSLAPDRLLSLTGLVAVAMCNAVERTAQVRPQIKWTNDLVLGGKKLCGILTELSIEGESGALQYVVIGVGVNVAHTREDFAGELAQIATSLAIETGCRVSRAALAAAMIEDLDRMYDALLRGDTQAYLDAYRRDCLTIGREVQLLWQDTRERVRAVGVDDELGLEVIRADGSRDIIRTGEVSVRGLYGYLE